MPPFLMQQDLPASIARRALGWVGHRRPEYEKTPLVSEASRQFRPLWYAMTVGLIETDGS